jgi:septal ring factor EnvC (AmiA/AmiB activator)
VECNEKDELKSGYSKLDEQYKKQATDIAKLKHECLEKEKELDEMNNTESKEEQLHNQLDKQTKEQLDQLNH